MSFENCESVIGEVIFGGIGYGAWSSGNITDEMIQEYLEHHKEGPNEEQNFILE